MDLHTHQNQVIIYNILTMESFLWSFWLVITVHSVVHDTENYLLCYRLTCGRSPTAAILPRSSATAACVTICGGGGGGGSASGLDKLNVIGWEHSKVSVWTIASPPAFINHLNPSDDFIWVKGDLCVVSWRRGAVSHKRTVKYVTLVTSDIKNSNFENVYILVLKRSHLHTDVCQLLQHD